ncbi:MAG: DUF3847 domain-containing protein [Lachnospiraceae bacterium]|nr:DUF3847 domain-containing protein [Lachnospiraceae bacterium]
MASKKTLEELEREYLKAKKELEQNQHKLTLAENQVAYLRKRAQKARTHRLITKGAAFESCFRETECLTEMEFLELVKAFSSLAIVREYVEEAVRAHKWREEESGRSQNNDGDNEEGKS